MKKIIAAVLIAAVGYFVWTSPTVGHWLYANASDAEASFFGFDQQSIDIGEVKIAAYVGGPTDKPAIVMLHGYTADKDVWPRFAKGFLKDYRVIIPDMAGHGDTIYDVRLDHSGPAQANRVAAILDALNIEKAHITGNSMGGFITAWFARLHPERTLSAAPIDPAGINSPTPSAMGTLIAAGKNPFFVNTTDEFKTFYDMSMAKPPLLPAGVIAAVGQVYVDRRTEFENIWLQFEQQNWLDNELQHIQAPTLLMWGSADQLLHVSAADVWMSKLPNAQLHIFEGIGHMPMVEIPAETAKVYRNFLEQLP